LAQVPVSPGQQIALRPLSGADLQPANYGAAGQAIGESAAKFGNAIGDYADVREQVQGLEDQAVVKEADNAASAHFAELGYTGADPYFNKQGKDALTARPDVEKSLNDYIDTAREGLSNERQRNLFDRSVRPQQTEWLTQIATHSLKETGTYEADQSKARIAQTGELARLTYQQDPKQGEQSIASALTEFDQLGAKNGWSREQTDGEKLKFTSGVYKDIGAETALTQGMQGVALARAFVEAHKASMTSDDRDAVLSRATIQENALNAQARQQEAEINHLANEARHDARDRVETGLQTIDTGLPLDAKTYAALHDDAVSVGDPNLVKRVEQGQFKNNLTIQHQNDTPVQLQNRVNELSADITKGGAKADPSQIIERDHLQQMLGATSSQLNTDPISWLAKARGVPITPLNLDDPTSIKNRVSAASMIPSLTGHAPAVFTPTETFPLAQQWHGGDAKQKTNLVIQLSRFGPLAAVAAQQVAPNDNGLVNLVALASHSNKGVGLSRVTQAMAGYEAMKTESQLVAKTATESDFSNWTGSALQFMPGAADGVFTTAKALLAADAAQHGWSKDTNPPDDKAWYRAVNSALGAYNRGGVQLGGLAGVNGAQTVLPENMSLDDFETRISRASDQQFRRAGNGQPVLGNGSALTAGDLKKMHFIPVREGVYRLESGGAFAHNSDGKPFEVDVRKLATTPGASAFNAELAVHGYARF
jgi:hypothetical protein